MATLVTNRSRRPHRELSPQIKSWSEAGLCSSWRRSDFALQAPELRLQLFKALRAAPAPEHKLYLDDLLVDGTSILRGALEHAASELDLTLSELARPLPPLEVYFPVDEHREAWDGDSDLLVAIQLNEAAEPEALSMDGQLRLLSLDEPPTEPVLMIVPAERLAGENKSGPSLLNSVTADGEEYPTGIYLRALTVAEDGEGWPRGDPEIEVDLVGPESAQSIRTVEVRSCAHEGAPSESHRQFDMNNLYWPSASSDEKVLVADSQSIAQVDSIFVAAGKGDSTFLMFHVWEDDTDRCVIHSTEQTWWDQVSAGLLTAGTLYVAAKTGKTCVDMQGNTWDCFYTILFAAAPFADPNPSWYQEAVDYADEFLGLFASPSGWVPTDSVNRPVRADVVSGSDVVGMAELAYMPGFPFVSIAGERNPTRPGPYEPPRVYRYDAETDFTRGDIEYDWQIKYGAGSWSSIGSSSYVNVTITQTTPSFTLMVEIINRNMLEGATAGVDIEEPQCDPTEPMC